MHHHPCHQPSSPDLLPSEAVPATSARFAIARCTPQLPVALLRGAQSHTKDHTCFFYGAGVDDIEEGNSGTLLIHWLLPDSVFHLLRVL